MQRTGLLWQETTTPVFWECLQLRVSHMNTHHITAAAQPHQEILIPQTSGPNKPVKDLHRSLQVENS